MLLLLNAREPVSFYYNLAVPLIAFVGILFWQTGGSKDLVSIIDLLYTLSAYTIYSSGLYGVGIMFAYWRENGLFLTFCKNRTAVTMLLIGQVILRSVATMLYVFVFLLFACLYFGEWIPSLLLSLPILTFFLSLLSGVFSLCLLLLPCSPRDLNAVAGVSVFIYLFLNALTFNARSSNTLATILNLFNPIYFNSRLLDFLNGGEIATYTASGLLISGLLFLLIGLLGLIHFKPHPILARL